MRRYWVSWFFSLRARLLLLVLLAMLPALGLTLYTAAAERRREVAKAKENALEFARLISLEDERLIQGTHQLLHILARPRDVRDGDPKMCSAFLSDVLKQSQLYANFGVATPEGQVFCSALPARGLTNIADRRYFRQAIETSDLGVGEYQIGRITGKATINFGHPILDNSDRLEAVVFAAVDLARLDKGESAVQSRLPKEVTFTTTDLTGRMLTHYPDPQRRVGQRASEVPLFATFGAQSEGVVEAPDLNGTPRFYAIARISASSQSQAGSVIVGLPKQAALAEANRLLARNLGGLALVAALTFAAAWVGSDILVLHPADQLVLATKRLEAGDLSVRTGPPYASGEIGQLARAFDGMAETLEQREAEREQTEEIRHALYEASREIQTPRPLAERLNHFLRTAGDVLHLDRVNILLPDPAGQWLQAAASLGTHEPLGVIRVPIGPEGGGPAQAYLTGQMIVWDGRGPVPETLRLKPPHDQIEAFRSRVFANVPLVVHGRAIGVLGVDRKHTRLPLDAGTLEMLQLFAGHAAPAIEQARLYEELRSATIHLEGMVEDRTRKLREAMQQAEAASHHKSEFLANMSHELRTPLNAVIGFSELLLGQGVGPLTEKQARYLGHIHSSGKHLLQLISDILDLAKVEAGKISLEPAPLPVATTLEDVLVIGRGLASKKGQVAEAAIEPDLPSLQADPVRFKQICFNLLSNAVKFTPEGGTVRLTARKFGSGEARAVSGFIASQRPSVLAGEWLEIRVTDTGVGIRPEDLPRLFQEFVQLETTRAQRQEGTGLGLALTKKLVELHGGRMWAESPGEGLGATFTVVLPFGGPGEHAEA